MRDVVLDLLTTPQSGTICTTFADVARVESYLWTLLSSSQYPPDIILPFQKDEIVECLKNFRSILTATGWKANNTNKSVDSTSNHRSTKSHLEFSSHFAQSIEHPGPKIKETEEFLQILNLLSILSRSLILAWNSYEKVHTQAQTSPIQTPSEINYSNVSLDSLLSCLTPGSASDLANLILEGVKLCYHHVWLKKYESFHLRHGFYDIHLNMSTRSLDEENQNHSPTSPSLLRKRFVRAGKILRTIDRKRYFGVHHVELPVRSIFQQICKHIPNYSVDVLHKIFEPTIQTINGIAPSTPPPQSSSSWSLWRR